MQRQIGDMITDPAEADLIAHVLSADEEAFARGEAPEDRAWSVPLAVMERLGFQDFALDGPFAPKVFERIRTVHASLYRASDLAVGGVHLGAFMFRDVFARITVPLIVGATAIDSSK